MGSAMWVDEPDTIKVSLVFKVDAWRGASKTRRPASELDRVLADVPRETRPLRAASTRPLAAPASLAPSLRRHALVLTVAMMLVATLLTFLSRAARADVAPLAPRTAVTAPVTSATHASTALTAQRVAPVPTDGTVAPEPFRTVEPR